MTFGEKIQKLRKQQGISQEVLAEKVTVTRQTISKWELDQSTPDLEFIAQLSDIFSVSTDYLIREELSEPAALPTQKKKFRLSEKARGMTFVLWSVTALAAIFVRLICEYFTSERLTWSFIALLAIVAAWCALLPCFTAKPSDFSYIVDSYIYHVRERYGFSLTNKFHEDHPVAAGLLFVL